VHTDWNAFIKQVQPDPTRLFAITTHGSQNFTHTKFLAGDVFVFGSETKGLDPNLRNQFPSQQRLRLPMQPDNRSLNLSNAVAIIVYEAWRQQGFEGGS
jgi:tRNA (cytidine/uridine-2'-O-)-methyltransferase